MLSSAPSSSGAQQQVGDNSAPEFDTNLMSLPGELFAHVDQFLPLEDSYNFKMSHSRIDSALHNNFHMYDKLFVSDDDSECRITDTAGRASTRSFKGNNTPHIIKMLPNLREITVIIKDVNLRKKQVTPESLSECTPYSQGGYLSQIFRDISPSTLGLNQLSVHVDIMIESLQDVFLQCPTEDLKYAMENLAECQFNSFVQISICCARICPSDHFARGFLLQGMQYALKQSQQVGATTEYVSEPCEGYVDMTVEKNKLEYTFAFFYYNPTICDPTPEEEPPVPMHTNYYL